MAKISYSACAIRPEEVPVCEALESGDYPQLYSERVKSILGTITDEGLREKIKQTLGLFEERDGRLAQSSPYRLVVLQDILTKGKVLVARPRLQVAKEGNPEFMSGFYVDFGLNLVSGEEGYKVNPLQAEELAKDLKQVGINLITPKLIPYRVLTHSVDKNSQSGLVFKLSEQGKDNVELILNTGDFKWNYLPSRNGLFRACLYRNGDWIANGDSLQYSIDNGRVVVETTGEASAKNFKELQDQTIALLDRQKRERQDLIARLQA